MTGLRFRAVMEVQDVRDMQCQSIATLVELSLKLELKTRFGCAFRNKHFIADEFEFEFVVEAAFPFSISSQGFYQGQDRRSDGKGGRQRQDGARRKAGEDGTMVRSTSVCNFF
jgi:hypothetical protein